MENYIKIGIGVIVLNGNKILLGHRAKDRKDTGGIYEPDCWAIPGGKQEYNETFFEGAKREIKEETNLDIDDLELFGIADDIQPDRHYLSIHIIANKYTAVREKLVSSWVRIFSFVTIIRQKKNLDMRKF